MDDLISRQEAIEAICKACLMTEDYHKCDGFPETSTWCDELVVLRAVPSAQSEQQWIPCSKRTPTAKRKTYWICTDTGYQCECRWTNVNIFWTDLTTEWHWHIMDIPQYSKVVAWRELPDPWEGEKDE